MRQRDSFESRMTRVRARMLEGDPVAVLRECDSAENAFGPNWRIDLNRGMIHTLEGRTHKAQVAWGRVKKHHSECSDYCCLSLGAYIGLSLNSHSTGSNTEEALAYINILLEAEPDDIFALCWRAELREDLWRNQTPENQLLEDAICDRRKAYALMRNLPDEKFYRLKIIRELSQVRSAEIERRCRDTQRMFELMQVHPIGGAPNVDQEPRAMTIANDWFESMNNPFMPVGYAHMPFVPAVPVHIDIGSSLAMLLLEKEEDCWIEALEIFDAIKPLIEQTGDTARLADTLLMTSALNCDIYTTIREDVGYLDAAKSKLTDLLRLSHTHTLNNETLQCIQDLETEIDKFTNARDA